MTAVYARVWVKDLGKVRRRVNLRTLLYPAAFLPAARLSSQIRDLSLLAVCAQIEGRASKVGICLPAHDSDAEERLAYSVSKMILAISKICDSSP